MFDSKRFLNDYSIRFDVEGKNCSPGRIQIKCPFCADHSNHLGMPIEAGAPNCWRCGVHSITKIIKTLLDTSWEKAKEVEKEYSQSTSDKALSNKYGSKSRVNVELKTLPLPKGSNDLEEQHRKYLKKRGFNPDEIIKTWEIKATSHVGAYKFRIVIPIIVDNKIVSYQARDITGKTELRYKACAIEDEIIHHKFVAYGADKIKNRKAIIVEGLLDVWKLGAGSVATFGTGFTKEQVLFLAERIDTAFILFDSEEDAQLKAEKLCIALSDCGVNCENITQDKYEDPGSMPRSEAEGLRISLLGY
jgi:DNA primase